MTTMYFLNNILGNVFYGTGSAALPTKYYLGVSKTAPNVNGENVTEPSGGGYSRVELRDMGTPADGVITNSRDLGLPEATADWGTITHFVLYDSPSGGNLLMAEALDKPRVIQSESQLRFAEGAIRISLTSND